MSGQVVDVTTLSSPPAVAPVERNHPHRYVRPVYFTGDAWEISVYGQDPWLLNDRLIEPRVHVSINKLPLIFSLPGITPTEARTLAAHLIASADELEAGQ